MEQHASSFHQIVQKCPLLYGDRVINIASPGTSPKPFTRFSDRIQINRRLGHRDIPWKAHRVKLWRFPKLAQKVIANVRSQLGCIAYLSEETSSRSIPKRKREGRIAPHVVILMFKKAHQQRK